MTWAVESAVLSGFGVAASGTCALRTAHVTARARLQSLLFRGKSFNSVRSLRINFADSTTERLGTP